MVAGTDDCGCGRETPAALVRHAETQQDAVLYLTASQTGMRQGELRALPWEDVDFTNSRIHINWSASTLGDDEDEKEADDSEERVNGRYKLKPPKSGKVRSVPLMPQVAAVLASLYGREHFTDDEDLIFPNEVGEVESDDAIRKRYYRTLKAAGLPHIRFHDLRHIFGSVAVKKFPLSDVQAWFGHANITTTMRYIHHRPGEDDGKRLGQLFPGGETPVDQASTDGEPADFDEFSGPSGDL